ncbi:MAG: Gfo/Idh/MocA family oxidoreductase [Bauldia sp.]
MRTYKVGIVGLGKIAHDQHVPVIAANPAFVLAGIASQRGMTIGAVPTFKTPEEMYAAVPDLDAVAVCTPPQVRYQTALAALAAGKHVMLEKPPAATLSELHELARFADARKKILFTTWHSQYNAAVAAAKTALAGKRVRRMAVNWKEDVRRWHPGQKWIWTPGGFGVFDPGINALSIVTRIMPTPIFVRSADLTFPENCDAPIAATLGFYTGGAGDEDLTAVFDWRQTGPQTWEIVIDTDDGERVHLENGGARLSIDGNLVIEEQPTEYEQIYERFREILDAGRSDVDPAPLRLVADAFLVGRRLSTESFIE